MFINKYKLPNPNNTTGKLRPAAFHAQIKEIVFPIQAYYLLLDFLLIRFSDALSFFKMK